MPGQSWLHQEEVEQGRRFDFDGAMFRFPRLACLPDPALAVGDQPAQATGLAPVERTVETLEQILRQRIDAAQVRAQAAFCTERTSRFGAACTSFSASFRPRRSMNFCFQATDP